MIDLSLYKSYRFWLILIFLFLPIISIYPFLKAEILTRTFDKITNFNSICVSNNKENPQDLRYFKIVDMDFTRSNMEIYCLYQNKNQNVALILKRFKS